MLINRVLRYSCFVVLASLFLAGCSASKPVQASLPNEVVSYGDETPSAAGRYTTDADTLVGIVDATSDGRLGDIPVGVFVGETVTFTSKEAFAVVPTEKGKQQVIEVHRPGEKIKIEKDGLYTVLIFGDDKGSIIPLAKDYIAVADEKGLKVLLEEIKRRMKGKPESSMNQA